MAGASATQRTARGSGYIGSIVVNALLLYGVGHVVDWQIGWITPAWSDVVWALNLSLEVSLVANALFFLYDRGWFRFSFVWPDPQSGERRSRAGMQSYRIEGGKLAETWITLLPLGTTWTDAVAQERWTSKPSI